ncbi:hypothetical protein [Halorussus amylolyticus]|uniref:hypothetical protein n=1 Tax=Halorussus amylolyticus TaxID=1126242 RepID=UPI0010511B62|nr:hypothetical protein [Halorussus amylolyticus]
MDVDRIVRQQEQPELPSEAMQEMFELWNKEYTLNALTNLNRSQIRTRKQKFEAEVEVLLTKHRPGRLVANRPSLAHLSGKPPHNAQEWKRAREMIRNEAKKVRFRLEQAEGLVAKEKSEARRAWITKLVKAFSIPDFNIKF